MTTSPDPESYRNELLAQLAAITSMERGALSEEYREVPAADGRGTLRLGPYFKHQCWEEGRNRSARVPASGFYLGTGFEVAGEVYDEPGIGPHVTMVLAGHATR